MVVVGGVSYSMHVAQSGGDDGGKGKHKRLRKAKLCYCFTSTWIHSHSGPGRCLVGVSGQKNQPSRVESSGANAMF